MHQGVSDRCMDWNTEWNGGMENGDIISCGWHCSIQVELPTTTLGLSSHRRGCISKSSVPSILSSHLLSGITISQSEIIYGACLNQQIGVPMQQMTSYSIMHVSGHA